MKKALIILSAIILLSISGCSNEVTSSGTDSSSQSSVSNSNASFTSEASDKKGTVKEIYTLSAGDNIISVVCVKEQNSDESYYKGNFELRLNDSTAMLTTPMTSETGIFVSTVPEESFETFKATVNDKNYEVIIFKSIVNDGQQFAACYIIDDNGIHLFENEFPTISGDIKLTGNKLVFSDSEKYMLDIENYRLLKK